MIGSLDDVIKYGNSPTFIMGRLEVFRKDYPVRLNFKEVNDIIRHYGEGWRLPTTEEGLYFISMSDLGIGKFNKENYHRVGYWTSDHFYSVTDQLRSGIYIDHRRSYGYNIVNTCLVRLVRDI
jgi:hypothetical protein